MPKDNIEDAIERATTEAEGSKEITYEMYGPGGVAMVIQTQTANRNKSAAEVRHIVTSAGYELAKPNAVVWAFEQERDDEGNVIWKPNNPVEVSDDDKKKVENLVEKLEENEEVAGVFTNVK